MLRCVVVLWRGLLGFVVFLMCCLLESSVASRCVVLCCVVFCLVVLRCVALCCVAVISVVIRCVIWCCLVMNCFVL